MNIVTKLIYSIRKSGRLRKLQLRIAPPGQTLEDVTQSFLSGPSTMEDERVAMEAFLDLCQEDEGVAAVMHKHQLKRTDLKDIYEHLVKEGLGQWINGHFAALSSIAYREPLYFFVESRAQGIPPREITYGLLDYWKGRIPNGGLYRALTSAGK